MEMFGRKRWKYSKMFPIRNAFVDSLVGKLASAVNGRVVVSIVLCASYVAPYP